MTIEEAIRQKLGEDAAVAAIVAGRIFPGEIPSQESPTPWIFYQLNEELPGGELGDNEWQSGTVELELFAETYAEVVSLKIASRKALNKKLAGGLYRCLWAGGSTQPVIGGHNSTERYTVHRTHRGVVEAHGISPVLGGAWILS